MRTKKLNLVSFHIADFDNPFFAALFEKIARKLGKENMMVVPCDGVDSVNEANQAVFACATILANAHGDKIRQVVQSGPVVTHLWTKDQKAATVTLNKIAFSNE
jgi:DNA-binding LacI/PurR family transcriptional regulator